MPSTSNKDKPWDTDEIDKWKIDQFTAADNVAGSFAEESSFMTLFPKYREQHLKNLWPMITKALAAYHIACTLDLINGTMAVRTTLKTWDPAAILNARDLIRLLARSVPAPQAIKILDDGVACDIIKIRGLVRNKEKFVKRRQRILGPEGSTLKALELLTNTYILVQGNTVATMGPYKGLKQIRRIIEDVFANYHPIYHIKELMIKRELEKDPELKHENWERFLPNYKKRALNSRRVPHKVNEKKKYTPFPPPREKSKVDLQIESGEYFLAKRDKERKSKQAREERQEDKAREKKARLEKEYVPPKEDVDVDGERKKKKKKKREREEHDDDAEVVGGHEEGDGSDKAKEKKKKKRKREESGDGEVGVDGGQDERDEGEKVRKKKKRKSEAAIDTDGNGEVSEKKKKRKKEKQIESGDMPGGDEKVKKEKKKKKRDKMREDAGAVAGDLNGEE